MQPEVSPPPTAGEQRRRGGAMPGGYEPAGTVSSAIDATTSGITQAVGFISEQTRMRPLLIGSMLAAMLGAIAGIRFAQMQAMRRRKSFYERAMETLGTFGPLIAGIVMRRRRGPMETLRERGEDITDVTSAMIGGVPMIGRARAPERGPAAIGRQVGYGISLIPVTMALIRNPLVRDFAFRYLARGIRRR